MLGRLNNLEKLARHVTAGDLQRPFGPALPAASAITDARDALSSFPYAAVPYHRDFDAEVERLCLVCNERGEPTHWVWGEDLMAAEGTVSDVAQPILPRLCVTDGTPALTLMRRLGNSDQPWCLVMTETQLTGFVTRVELFRPELRVCVLAILLDVEQRCADAVTWDPGDAERAWARLSPGRQAKALEMCARKYGRIGMPASVEQALFCTTFIDKAALVSALPQFSALSRKQLHDAFSTMEQVRNSMVHTSFDPSGELGKLLAAIQLAESFLTALVPDLQPAPLNLVVSNPSQGIRGARLADVEQSEVESREDEQSV